jgi:hypothetical protein
MLVSQFIYWLTVCIPLVEYAEKETAEILVCSLMNTWSPLFSSWKILSNIYFTRIWLSLESYISDSSHRWFHFSVWFMTCWCILILWIKIKVITRQTFITQSCHIFVTSAILVVKIISNKNQHTLVDTPTCRTLSKQTKKSWTSRISSYLQNFEKNMSSLFDLTQPHILIIHQ